jgi:DNA-binding transcriptional MerR regulator
MPTEATYTIADLARLSGLNVRTIRYYLAQGLIPASGESGPGAHYGDGHLDRLRLTKRLQAQHLPLSEIRGRLAELSDEDVAGLVAVDVETPAPPVTSALEYVRSVLGSTDDPHGRARSMPIAAYSSTGTPPPAAPTVAPSAAPAQPVAGGSSTPARRLLTAARRLRMPETGIAKGVAAIAAESAHTNQPTDTAYRAMPRMRDVPAAAPAAAAAAVPATTPSPTEPQSLERSQWERLSLGPNIELHIRRPLSRLEQRRVDRLITIARQVLNEDQS